MGYSPRQNRSQAEDRTSAQVLHDKILSARPRQRGGMRVLRSFLKLVDEMLLELAFAVRDERLPMRMAERLSAMSRGEILISLYKEIVPVLSGNQDRFGLTEVLRRRRYHTSNSEVMLEMCVQWLSIDQLCQRYGIECWRTQPRGNFVYPHHVIYGQFLREHSIDFPAARIVVEDLAPISDSSDPMQAALGRRELRFRALNNLL